MGRKFIAYTGGLIALYIVAAHASNMGRLFTAGGQGGSQFVKTLQGR